MSREQAKLDVLADSGLTGSQCSVKMELLIPKRRPLWN